MNQAEWRLKYEKYLQSAQWKNTRIALIRMRDHRCERCGKQQHEKGLEVHHLTYERLGRERVSDLQVLCLACHRLADEERAAAGRRKSRKALHNARFEGWLRAVYGDEWQYFTPGEMEAAEERFELWLERQDD